jgi:hypothetical protein
VIRRGENNGQDAEQIVSHCCWPEVMGGSDCCRCGIGDELAIDEQFEVICPTFAIAGDNDSEEKPVGLWVDQSRDAILCSFACTLHLLRMHIIE